MHAVRYESMKMLNREMLGAKDAPVRPTTTDEDGATTTIHKFKFQRIEQLDVVSVSDFPDSTLLENGFVIHFPEGPMYYRAESAKAKAKFLAEFREACEAHSSHVGEKIDALQRAFTSRPAGAP